RAFRRRRIRRPSAQPRSAPPLRARGVARRGGAGAGCRSRPGGNRATHPAQRQSAQSFRADCLSGRSHRSHRPLTRGGGAARDAGGDRPSSGANRGHRAPARLRHRQRLPHHACAFDRAAGLCAGAQPGRGGCRLRGAAGVPHGPGEPSPAEPDLERTRALLLRNAVRRALHLGRDRRHHPHALRTALHMSGEPVSIAGKAAWLADADLQKLLAALSADGEEARIAGGAVRDALLGQGVTDIDIATTNLPDSTIERAERAGFRSVPTGKDHGTITVIAGGRPFEVTTLRADVETYGRKAKVAFGRDWKKDAERRDFTINALYAEADGTVIDLVGGVADLDRRILRFIGDAEARIREDYLRILRFFRFYAWYGEGRPDAEGLKACARLKGGLD